MRTTKFQIAGRVVGQGHSPFVIAELSANHNGDIERAFAIMKAARDAGADAVKLQTYTADTMTIDHDSDEFRIHGGLWDGRRLYELYQEAQTPWAWHEALFDKARDLGLIAFSSPFDESAVDFLESLGAPAYKIASFELIDTPLIRYAAKTGKPLILSTGMATDAEIGEAISVAQEAGAGGVALLHCVSGYPTPAEEANLARIPALAEKFNCAIGLSDHSPGVAVAIAGAALGAAIIEKHFTLARADGGPDAAFSLEPDELAALVKGVLIAHSALGRADYGRAGSEQPNMTFRRSLYAVKDIAAGEELTGENVRSIRPGYGLAPKHLPEILGRRAARAISRGTPMSFDILE
jgi:N-acetylneuraminate synthase